ncbi:hypothetical protein DL770_006601 [Monosporascus sp. CRB-9-2]|nr:hypothetical protein DL770_006601 [Monosporascus sp. CRB-9-2]
MASLLTLMWLWGIYDRSLSRAHGKQYKTIDLPKNPTYTTQDVSILVPTINTPEEFTQCLLKWAANKPKEILIVTTTRDFDNVNRLVQPVLQEVQTATIIQIYTVSEPGRREQMKLALEKATGSIVAFVDDDTIWPTEKVLPFLIAGFEDPEVGGVAGKQRQALHAFIPAERQDPNTVTPWEVAAMRFLSSYNHGTAAQYAADGGVFCLVGRTMLARAKAVQNPEFLHALTNEFWRGKKINTGDDSFMTRWLHTRGWKFRIQDAPEAEVLTIVERDATFVKQLVRWRRSGFQGFVRRLTYEPGFFEIYKKQPYFARKLLQALFGPLIILIHLWAWATCIRDTPLIALIFAGWYVFQGVKTYHAYLHENPWIGLRNLWAVVAIDHAHLILDLYTMTNLNTEGWMTRDDQA